MAIFLKNILQFIEQCTHKIQREFQFRLKESMKIKTQMMVIIIFSTMQTFSFTHTLLCNVKKTEKKKGNTSVYKLSNIIISFNVYENLNVILTVTITLNVRRTKHNLILIYIEKKNNRIID